MPPNPTPTPPPLPALQQHRTHMLQQEQQARQHLASFFRQLRDCLNSAETELLRALDRQMLDFHEGAASTVKALSNQRDYSDSAAENAIELTNCRVFHGSKVDPQQLQELLRQVYFVKVGASHEQSRVELPCLGESRSEERMFSESAVEKIQCERDYYQKREEELQVRIREFENSKRGANIRELSKSALEQKCSKWAIDRLREEKRVLVEKIGEASQQIMRQDALLSQYQEEIRRLSAAGNSSIKGGSMIMESEISHQRQCELEARNAQLAIELTSHMQRVQQIYEANRQLQQDIEKAKTEQAALQAQIDDLKQENAMLNNDYQASLKKKAVLEQQYNELKKGYEEVMSRAQEQKGTMRSLIEGLQLGEQEIKQRLKRMEVQKKAEISSMEQKLANSLQQREKLLRRIEEISSKSGQQNNFKQLLNDEIARLLKQNAQLERQIHEKENLAFEAKEESARLELQTKESIKKAQALKKEISQLKKAIKQSDKQKNELKAKVTMIESTQFKVMQLQQHLTHLQSEFTKNKDTNDRKAAQHERVMTVLKQRYNLQLSQLLAEDNKKPKKEKSSKMETIQRYIEEMVTFSSKTAQVKQLKEQIRELKDKQGRQIKKKQKTTMEESVSLIEWGMYNTNAKIFEQRLKNQKEIFEERLIEMAQLLKKEELIKNALNEELEREKLNVLEIKNKVKQQKTSDDSAKNVKQLQDKVQRLEQESKKVKAKNKKLQADLNDAQSQAKTKKDLNVGLRNQIKAKEDLIIQLYKDIESLKSQIDKLQRNTRQMGNKEELLRQSKELFRKIEVEKEQLLQSLEQYSEKNKQLTRQVAKKDEVIKELTFIQGKESKKKDDVLIRSLNNEITDLKEANRKLKMDSDRKDEIIRNNKAKLQVKSKENEDINMRISKDYEKATKDKEAIERKLESTASNLKKQQLKSNNLSWAIKKIFEMCSKAAIKPQKQQTKIKPETTQYYTNSTISPHTLKMGTPASNLKSFISCEGLEILNLRPEDIEQCLGVQVTAGNKSDLGESWCMASPIANKRKEQERRQAMMEGLQEIQRILSCKQLSCNLLLEQFKQILDK